jgi:competence transcription factor ComK
MLSESRDNPCHSFKGPALLKRIFLLFLYPTSTQLTTPPLSALLNHISVSSITTLHETTTLIKTVNHNSVNSHLVWRQVTYRFWYL